MDKMITRYFKPKMLATLCALSVSSAVVANDFVISDIQVQGTERIGFETLNTYLPVRVGETLTLGLEQESIRALFRTGFFNDIALFRGENDELIIQVVERPSIADITIKGNRLIKTDDLKKALTGLGITQGKIYNPVEMERVILDLRRQYHNQGYYAAQVQINAEELPRNRVALNIDITEGAPASIERISLVGNSTYTDTRLKGQLLLKEVVLFGSADKYSRPKLQADLETLRSFYLDRGFAEFDINSSQVALSEDLTEVYISVNMTEGPQYRLDQLTFTGSDRIPEAELRDLLNLEAGELFSRSRIVEGINSIRDRFSDLGFAFAEVDPRVDLNQDEQLASINFVLDEGSRVYVRRIEIEGNTRTRDHVLRREMRQFEKAPYSLQAVRQSTSRLNRLGYFSSVNVDTRRVSDDEVDLVIQVEEQPTGSFTAGIGFSQLDGISFNLGIAEKNLLGSGNELELSVNSSVAIQSADIGFTDPYFTKDGVSLSTGIFYSKVDASELNITDYTLDRLGGRISLGYPTSELTRLNMGLRVEEVGINCNASNFVDCNQFVDDFGQNNAILSLTGGWRYDSRNSFFFPTEGHNASISAQAAIPGSSDVTFYKIFLDEAWWTRITDDFTLKLSGSLAFGEGYGDLNRLPFYERYFAGGIGSVRGFEPNSLGGFYQPEEGSTRPRGGDARAITTAELVFPMPLIEDSSNIRLSWFVDGGNIYSTLDDVDPSDFRIATGLGFSWITPVGPLAFSFSRAIKSEKEDKLQSFQFSLGVPF
jgi:outer membrane protein insertion porin family